LARLFSSVIAAEGQFLTQRPHAIHATSHSFFAAAPFADSAGETSFINCGTDVEKQIRDLLPKSLTVGLSSEYSKKKRYEIHGAYQ
jgi:hypothetical protein